jgi:hypothetical protein
LDKLAKPSIKDQPPGQNFALFAAHEKPDRPWRGPE